MSVQQPTGGGQEIFAAPREADMARSPVEEAAAETILQTLDAKADRRLRRVERFRRTGKVAEIGRKDEGAHAVDVEGPGHDHNRYLSQI